MKKRSHLFFLGGFLILLFLAGFYLLSSPFLTIKQVDVKAQNLECVDQKELKNSSMLLGQNFLLINSSKIKNELKSKYICVRDVTIERAFPNRVTLNIFGREPVAIIVALKLQETSRLPSLEFEEATDSAILSEETPMESFLVDDEGVLYSQNIDQINAPRIYLQQNSVSSGGKLEEDLIRSSLKILIKIKGFGVLVKEAKISKDSFLISAIPKIIFKLDDKIDTQLASLQLILTQAKIDKKEMEFIDLRFDKPVVRFAPQKK